MSEWPRDYKNPSEKYLDIERQVKGQKICVKILKGFRITREEYSEAVEKGVLRLIDSDEDYERFMSKWKETEKSFGYFHVSNKE